MSEEEKDISEPLSSSDSKISENNSNEDDKEMRDQEDSSEVDKSDSDTNIGSLFQDIPAEEWVTERKTESRSSSVHSANTEKAENDSETECDLVLVDRNAWQAAEQIKAMKSSQDLEYDSDDTVELKALADSMHEPADQENDDEVDNASEASVHSAERIASDDQVESNEDAPAQGVNSSRRKSLNSEKLNSSRRKSLNETGKKSRDTSMTELNSSKKRKSLTDSSKKNTSIRDVNTADAAVEKHFDENVSSPLPRKDSLGKRKSLNSSLIQTAVSHIKKNVMMEATSTPFKDKVNPGIASFGNITLFKKQGEKSVHETSSKTLKLKSGLIDEDDSGSDIVNVSGKKKNRSQRVSSDEGEEEAGEEEIEEEEEEEEEIKTDKSSSCKKKKLESSAKNISKLTADVNYSKIVEVDSSESNSDPESDNSDWANESRKIPRFLFAQAGDTSHEGSEEESDQKSIDSDVAREYNLDGKSDLKYSDDNVPGDVCRPSETESSDSEDDGADLKDFIVDDDEVEDEESEDEEAADEEAEEAADEEVEKAEDEEVEEAEDEEVEEAEDEEVEEAADEEVEEAADEEVEEVVEKAENEVVEKTENEEVEEAKNEEVEEMEYEEIKKAKKPNVQVLNGGIEKAENEEINESETEEITDANVKNDNKQKNKDKVKAGHIVKENVETNIVPSDKSGTMKFNVVNISSPRSSPKVSTKPTNSWLVDEDVKVEADKTSREVLSSPFDLMKKKRKRSGSDGTPDLRSRKMKRLENTQEILMEEEEIEQVQAKSKSVVTQKIEKRKLVINEDTQDEPATTDKTQKKIKKADKLKKNKEIPSEVPQTKAAKTKKNVADLVKVEKTSKKQRQLAEVETNSVPKAARSKEQTAEHPETVKSKKRKEQSEKIEDNTTEVNNKKPRKKANENVEKATKNKVSKKPQIEVLSDSDEAPEVVAFAKAKEEALRAIKETTESIKIRKELQKKKQMDHLERMRQEREQKERKANRMELIRADKPEKTLKRLPSEVIENLSDAPRPRKKQKVSKKGNANDVLPSRSLLDPNVKVDENFITLSSTSGSTSQFDIVNLQKVEKRAKKATAITTFRQKMLARNTRQPVSTYLAYLRKQKASGKDKHHAKPF